jgi:hypothetical protein
VQRKHLEGGSDVHKFQTLPTSLSTITRNIRRQREAGPEEPTFPLVAIPNAEQRRALDVLDAITPYPAP